MATGVDEFRNPVGNAVWMVVIAFLMISNIATLSWRSIKPRRSVRLELIAFTGMLFAALLMEPWWSLATISIGYLALMPWGVIKYSRIKRQRVTSADNSPLEQERDAGL